MEMNGEIITDRDNGMRYIITNGEIISLNQLVYGEIGDLLGWDNGQQQIFQHNLGIPLDDFPQIFAGYPRGIPWYQTHVLHDIDLDAP